MWLLNAMAAVLSLGPASEVEADPLLLRNGQEHSFEQLLSEASEEVDLGLSQNPQLLNEADSVFLMWREAQPSQIAIEVQAPRILERPQQLQVKVVPASSGDAPQVTSLNATAMYTRADMATSKGSSDLPSSKGDMAPSSGMGGTPNSNLENAGSLRGDGKIDFASSATRLEMVGFSAVILVTLWCLLAGVIILIHADQKSDQRWRAFALHCVPRRGSRSIAKAAARAEWARRAQSQARTAHEERLRVQAANANTSQGEVHAG